jgi:hypothetical protein
MSGTRFALGKTIALGVLLALSVLLLVASEAKAAKYAVAQCGWFVGADADWADTTGGAKFRPDSFCVPAPGADPFDGVHMKSLTREGQTSVTGTRFARWRWSAPAGTAGITAVRGTWWHALHDGIEQRIGGVSAAGAFAPSLSAGSTDTALRDFSLGFATPVAALEDRLLCARGEDKWCSLDQQSWSGLRALTLTVEDDAQPAALLTGGSLVSGGWQRGNQWVTVGGSDAGAGVRFGETFVDGSRATVNEWACNKVSVGGEWRATTMRPCPTSDITTHWVDTTTLSDGPHRVVHCESDFAGNGACTGDHGFLVDNNPPAHPRAPTLAGGDGWRRVDDFDLDWQNPDQGAASPIAGASWRVAGPLGFDTGARFATGRDRHSLADLSVPAAGAYSLQLWLRDEAGNEAPASAVTVPLRFDDVRPKIAFATDAPADQLVAVVEDADSGPGQGQILCRRLDADQWRELPTRLVPGGGPGEASLVAAMPDLGFGTFVFRADARDLAGNEVSTTLRADGTQMAVRNTPPPRVPRAKTRLFARLRGGRGDGDALTVPFAAAASLGGRLVTAEGAGIAGRELRVVSRPSRGALQRSRVSAVRTDERGNFELRLRPGPSRRITVTFPGDAALESASRRALELRTRSGVTLQARPASLSTGEAVRFSGRVAARGAPIPRRGKLVAIQYLEQATRRWRPVLVTRTDHDGRFVARYRFRYVSGSARVRLRATALAEERWPYAPGSSAPVTVLVHGR